MIAFLKATDEIKLNLQLLKTIFMILLYIHVLACIWYAYSLNESENLKEIGKEKEAGVPGQPLEDDKPNFFSDYTISFKFILGSFYLLCGALMQAYMFGNLAVMVQQLNRKTQSF